MNQPNAPLPYWGPPRPASLPGSVVLLPGGLAAAASGPAADGGRPAEGLRPALEPGGTAGVAAWRGAGGSLSLFLRPGAPVLSAWRCMRRGRRGRGLAGERREPGRLLALNHACGLRLPRGHGALCRGAAHAWRRIDRSEGEGRVAAVVTGALTAYRSDSGDSLHC